MRQPSTLQAAILEGGPLHNGKAASITELIGFNRAWRRLLTTEREKLPATMHVMGLIYSAGKIRQGEAWEAEPISQGTQQRSTLQAAILEGGPLHNGQAATIGKMVVFNRAWRRLLTTERASAPETLQALGLIYSAGKIRQGEAWEAEPLPEKNRQPKPSRRKQKRVTVEELLAKWDADQARKKALAKTKKRKPPKRKLGTPYRPRQKPEETEEQHAARLMGLIKNNPVTT